MSTATDLARGNQPLPGRERSGTVTRACKTAMLQQPDPTRMRGPAVALAALLAATSCHAGPGGAPRMWILLPSAAPLITADLVLANGVVVTGNTEQPLADSVAIAGGKVLAVGPAALMLAFAGPSTVVTDLDGAVVLPGLTDAHGHVAALGDALASVDLVGTRSFEEVVDRVRHAAARQRTGWIVGRGWDQNDWEVPEFPDGARLEAALPGREVWLQRVDGHAAVASPAALAASGIDASIDDPPGGRILRRDGGREPTGVLIDRAMDRVKDVVPPPSPDERRARMRLALEKLASVGLTGVHDMGVSAEVLATYRDLDARGELTLRIYVALADDERLLAEEYARGHSLGERLTVRAVKLYADGALGSRGAALLHEYADDPGNTGLWVTDREALREKIGTALANGFQPCVHAIGDAANRAVLDAFAEQPVPVAPARPRIEHAQVIDPEDLPRFAQLGVIASVQPTHATSDMPWAESRVGAERLRGAYAWRSLLDAGTQVAFGSDFPVERPEVLEGIFAAIARTSLTGEPRDGWRPEERLTFGEALAGFTSGAARAAFAEERRGRIVPGADADLTVASGELAALARGQAWAGPTALTGAKPLATLVEGRATYVDASFVGKLPNGW